MTDNVVSSQDSKKTEDKDSKETEDKAQNYRRDYSFEKTEFDGLVVALNNEEKKTASKNFFQNIQIYDETNKSLSDLKVNDADKELIHRYIFTTIHQAALFEKLFRKAQWRRFRLWWYSFASILCLLIVAIFLPHAPDIISHYWTNAPEWLETNSYSTELITAQLIIFLTGAIFIYKTLSQRAQNLAPMELFLRVKNALSNLNYHTEIRIRNDPDKFQIKMDTIETNTVAERRLNKDLKDHLQNACTTARDIVHASLSEAHLMGAPQYIDASEILSAHSVGKSMFGSLFQPGLEFLQSKPKSADYIRLQLRERIVILKTKLATVNIKINGMTTDSSGDDEKRRATLEEYRGELQAQLDVAEIELGKP